MKVNIAGYEFDSYTREEAREDLHAAFSRNLDASVREQLRGIKPIKLPIATAVASGASLTLGGSGINIGPESGYFWRIGRITISSSSGTDTGAVSLYVGNDPSNLGQQYLIDNTLKVGAAYYPGTRGLFLWPGEQLYVSIASTAANSYRLSGVAVEVPAEMAGKILGG